MWRILSLIIPPVVAFAVAPTPTALAETKSGDCKVVERKDNPNSQTSGMTSSVTAGGGRVSGTTTGAGNSITVHSGDGKTSSSVATAGGSGNSTVVAGSGSGDCTIYVNPGEKK
jgi:hypothetical protein